MKTTSSFRLLALGAVMLAVAMGACVAQPPQQCQVAQGVSALTGLPQFWVQYKLLSGTGSCSMLTGDEVGFQSYINPTNDNELKFAIRPGALGTLYADGRVDPMDPDGKKINTVFKMTPFPDSNYVCKNDGPIPEAVQNFQEEMMEEELDDGGTQVTVIPALTIKYQWADTEWLSSPSVTGQAFHAKLTYTEDACTATYEATGIWPLTSCATDLDCSPNPVPDAGVCTDDPTDTCPDTTITQPSRRLIGSGLNPDLTVKCDRANGACVLAVPFSELVAKKP